MPDIIKNLNYSAEEINDMLGSVSTKAGTTDLEEVRQDVTGMTNLIHDYMEEKNTKFAEIDEKFTSIDSAISSINENITGKADIATTLAGYGILDAKIEEGVITLGGQSITPITEHQDVSGKADSSKIQELEQKISDLTDRLNAAIERITALETSSSQTELGGSE